MKLIKITLITMVVLLVTACTEDKYSRMSKQELTEKKRHCDSIPKKSAVFAAGCENIRKEIERRKEQKK